MNCILHCYSRFIFTVTAKRSQPYCPYTFDTLQLFIDIQIVHNCGANKSSKCSLINYFTNVLSFQRSMETL